ncbi:MAG: hypothetical protein HY718_16445 [Planctomycetes bacterium]|nr:hypothetical protein [Planctomycetota bacterium]
MNQFRSIAERVERFRRFYERRNDRPLLGFFVGSDYPLHRYEASRTLPTDRTLVPADFEVEPYLDDCDRLFDLHESCGGDFIWSGSAFWGIPWLEVALGCPVKADHSTGSIHAELPPSFRGPDDVPEFDARSPWMLKAVEFLERMAHRSAGRWPIGTTRMRGISDLLSALYGGTDFIMAMLDRPDDVKRVCERLTEFWIAFGKLQLRHIPPFYGGLGSFYYNMWAPPGTIWHQEDAAALLSPQLYDEFIRPWDERIVASFDGCIMHQHPTRFVPTDFYLKMGFTALELHVDKGGPSAEALYPQHRKIMERVPLLIWGDLPRADLDWIFGNLPTAGLAVLALVRDPSQAADVWKRYVK